MYDWSVRCSVNDEKISTGFWVFVDLQRNGIHNMVKLNCKTNGGWRCLTAVREEGVSTPDFLKLSENFSIPALPLCEASWAGHSFWWQLLWWHLASIAQQMSKLILGYALPERAHQYCTQVFAYFCWIGKQAGKEHGCIQHSSQWIVTVFRLPCGHSPKHKS